MSRCDLGVNVVPVVGTIAGEGRHRTIHSVEQGADLQAIIGIPAGLALIMNGMAGVPHGSRASPMSAYFKTPDQAIHATG